MSMINYALLLNHYMAKELLKDVSQMSRKSFIRKLPGIEPWELNVVTAPLNTRVGKNSSSKDNYQAKAETQNGSGTPTSQKNGVTLTIQYKGIDDTPINKIIKLTREQADDFIQELNEEIPFATIETDNQTITIPSKNITEIRIEEDEAPIGKGKGKKTSDLGGGTATKSS